MYGRSGYVPVKIKVVGIGGGGCNALNHMIQTHISGVEYIAVNTDIQHLNTCETPVRLALGEKVTHGLGAGGDPDLGKKCTEVCADEIKAALQGTDMVFLAAGMGGGTGTGATPIIAEIAKQGGTLTAAIVTRPFNFEGRHRTQVAEEGIKNLSSKVDTLIVISNDRALELFDTKTNLKEAFLAVDQILCQAVKTIIELVTVPGIVNVDFASVRNMLKNAGQAYISIGRGTGENRAMEAAKNALKSSLVDVPLKTARKVLFRIAGGGNLTALQVNDAATVIKKAIHPEADIFFGVLLDPNLANETRLTLIATGFENKDIFMNTRVDQEKHLLSRT
jgi:cell division protein FtsZ